MTLQPYEIMRAQAVLEIHLMDYQDDHETSDLEMMRAVSLEMRDMLLALDPVVSHANRYSGIKDLIEEAQSKSRLDDVQIIQALASYILNRTRYLV